MPRGATGTRPNTNEPGNISPGPDIAIRASGADAWFGWPTDPKMEALREAWFDAPDMEAQHKLLELKSREYVQEPLCVSPRPVLGRLLVFSRKAVFHLFMKWFSRPVLEQQNLYNQTVARLLEDLLKTQEASERRLRELEARLAAADATRGDDALERKEP